MLDYSPDTEQPRASTLRPVVLITGAAGDVGSALIGALRRSYEVVGLDLEGKDADCELIPVDLTSQDSVQLALNTFRERHGGHIAAVIHLAAYFDFSGEKNPLYDAVNVEGTRHLVRGLRDFEVDQFIYSGTMLVHRPAAPGTRITENAPIEPKWPYPESKAAAEEVIRQEHGRIPLVMFHLAGLYDGRTAIPTLTQQIRRIYERSPKGHAYSGSLDVGQSFVHKEDMVDAFVRAVDRRDDLPQETTMLVGEREAPTYDDLQHQIARLIYGEEHWKTFKVSKPIAKLGAWLETKSEPIVPDDIDHGEKPFIQPFMVEMADDNYELDTSRARDLLGWRARHSIEETLPTIIENLKADPLGWYQANGLTPPHWLTAAEERTEQPERLRAEAEASYRAAHRRNLWAPFLNVALGSWLATSPLILGYESSLMTWSDVVSGVLVAGLALLSLSWQMGIARWGLAALGLWVMTAPLVFWAPTAAAYLNGTLVGALIVGFAVLVRPAPGLSIVASTTGPTIPIGWDYCPSSWFQRLPIILLAFVGLYISRYLAAFQLGHIDGVFEPFFMGQAANPQNGTEEIITSTVSEAWPVPDAGLGALTYMMEILVGIVGSQRRWRTMPWLVVLFGIMIVPLGAVSITFIIIQPIVIGTYCTLCLVAAAAMLLQIPYSIDELVATGQFLARRRRAGRPLLHVFIFGDTDDGPDTRADDDFTKPAGYLLREMVGGGMSVIWSLAASAAIGVWLMLTRLTLGSTGVMADADYLIGALVIAVAVTATAETARPVRFLNVFFGMALAIIPFVAEATLLQTAAGVAAGIALIFCSIPRGPIRNRYGSWNRVLV